MGDNNWQEVNRKNRRSVFDRLKPSLSQKSNVDDLAKISLSVYVSNFPSHLMVRELWNICGKMGTLMDVYIAKRKNKLGQMFIFCCYIKLYNSKTLIDSLANTWIGKLRLHANVARFYRNMVATTPRAGVNGNIKADIPDRSYNTKANSYAFVAKTPYVDNMKGSYSVREDIGDHNPEIDLSHDGSIDFPFVVLNIRILVQLPILALYSDLKERLVWLEVEGVPIHAWDNAVFRSICNKWGDMFFSDDSDMSNRLSKRLCIKSKHSQLIFATIFVTVRKITYAIRVRELCSRTPSFTGDDSDCDDENYMDTHAQVDKSATEKNVDDPFGDILADNGEEFFNADVVNSDKEDADPQVGVHGDDAHDSDPFRLEPLINMKASKVVHESVCSKTPVFPPGFSPQCVDDHSSVKDHPPGFSTKMQQDHAPVVRSLNDLLASDSNSLGGSHKSVGFSLVERLEETIKVGLALGLNMEGCSPKYCLMRIIDYVVVEGDFNEVREASERFGSSYNERQAGLFNNFISNASLIDVPLGGYKFTWTDKWGSKMSKIDRFLVSKLFYETFPNISGVILEKGISNHRPILIKDYVVDFGPTPFWFFHSWFKIEGFYSMVVDTWKNDGIVEANGLISFKKKLQNLKRVIREWVALQRSISLTLKKDHLMRLSSVDTKIDQGLASEMDLCDRRESIRILGDLDKREASDIA
ncbi:RNA-directed DNA polymerase, eukaryota [Tanacetum coccineum]|uniref:RNA-directed DNA polymerase, eukaryota n=1 Tax=Tanacetum coccineum TaxID=301880 RepID=A0ABQ5D520_9ASTR